MSIKNKVLAIVTTIVLIFPPAAFAWNPNMGGGGLVLVNPGLPEGSIYGIISGLLYWLLAIFAIVGIMGFVISGIIYLLSVGDEDTISKAKKAMVYSIIGIIVGLSGFVIIQAVMGLLSGVSNTF